METSALNAAHAKERRAEALVRERKYEEAAKCHEQAAHLFAQIIIKVNVSSTSSDLDEEINQIKSYFNKTVGSGGAGAGAGAGAGSGSDNCSIVVNKTNKYYYYNNNDKQINCNYPSSQLKISAIESIKLQRDYHKKQAAFVRMKQAQYEEYKATMEIQEKELQSRQLSLNKNSSGKLSGTGNFVTVDRGEKFLHQAIDKAMEEQDSLLELILPPRNGNLTPKRPKDPAVVLEELRTVNGQLRSLIGTLLGQLEASQQEVKILTEQLRAAKTCDKEPIQLTNENNSINLSPLPPLAPLEMPPFDFSTH